MLYIHFPVLYYHGNLYVTEGALPGARGFPLSQRSFLFVLLLFCLLVFNSLTNPVIFLNTWPYEENFKTLPTHPTPKICHLTSSKLDDKYGAHGVVQGI